MIKAVIFDMDGVLVNSEPLYAKRKEKFFQKFDINISNEQLLMLVGKGMQDIFAQLSRDGRDIETWKLRYLQFIKEHPIAYKPILQEGVVEILTYLNQQGFQCALASASLRCNIDNMLEECGLSIYFKSVIGSEDVERTKPFPDIYQASMKALDITREECLVIEDFTTGIQAAKAAGCFTIALKDMQYGMDQSKADKIINNLTEIKQEIMYLEKQSI